MASTKTAKTDVKTASKSEVPPTEEKTTAVVSTQGGDVADLYHTDAGETGFEGTRADDYQLPFVKLLQKMSPEVDEDNGAYVEGAKPGMYYDAASGALMTEFDFIACHYHRAIVEWRDRDASGGGFVAQHPLGYEANCERIEKNGKWTGRWRSPTEPTNYLVDTRYFFGLRLTEGGDHELAVLSMSSTQTKKARAWLTRMQAMKARRDDGSRFQLPMFASVWRFSSVPEENDQGAWRGYKIDYVGPQLDRNLRDAAKNARDMFVKAAVNVKPPSDDAPAATYTGTSDDDTMPY